MKYTYQQIEDIAKSIQVALKQDLNKIERTTFLKNLKVCKSKLKELSELFLDNNEKFVELQNKIFKAYVDNGAKAQQLPNGLQQITDESEMDKETVEKEVKKLKKKYKEAIDKQQEITEENKKTKQERQVEVEWFTLGYEDFTDDKNYNVLNENTLEFIDA